MIKTLCLFSLRFYQRYISAGIIAHLFPGLRCRFSPTCSAFTYQAVARYGTIIGLLLGLRRLLRCHPWGGAGYDPVK